VAVGTHRGNVQIWDVGASKKVTVLDGHSARVGALAWNGDCISSGSRDRLIFQRDIRQSSTVPGKKLEGHRQEVGGH
jgi:cell division cycle 20-like protein 1 (cofactor of APC complex)